MWGRIFENKFKLFSFTIGMFPRPFGYEINLASVDRESQERGRMSQLLMKGERDLGAMVSFEVRKEKHFLNHFKIDAGLFNDQGIVANGDFDNRKDFTGRVALKPVSIDSQVFITAGASMLYGGFTPGYQVCVQSLFSLRHHLVIKYDWYDPNTKIAGKSIGVSDTGFSAADVKYQTLNIGYNFAVTPVVRLSVFYAIVKNETTALPGLEKDVRDNILTGRLQFRF